MDKKENIGKKNRLLQYGVLIVALIMIIGSYGYATIIISDEDGIRDDVGSLLLIKSDDFIIYEVGGIVYSINGSSGLLFKSDVNFTKVLQDTITELDPNPGSILIRAPISSIFYNVTKTIVIPDSLDGLTLRGSGYNWNTEGVVLKAGNSGVDPIILNNASGQTFFWIDKISFDADVFSVTCLTVKGFDTKITSCSFVGGSGVGIKAYTNVFIRDCWIENLVTGVDLYGQNDVFINNNIFWDNTYDIQTSVGSTRLTVTENRFKDSNRVLRVSATGGEHIMFANNVILDIVEYVLHFNGAKTTNFSFIGNMVDGGGVTPNFMRIESPRVVTGIISDNTIIGLTGDFLLGDYNCTSGLMILDNKGYENNSLMNYIESASEPVVRDNSTVYWYDTDGDYLYQIVNTYGDTWYLNYTKAI